MTDDQEPKRPSALYGFCPICGEAGQTRTRTDFQSFDTCKAGHTYPARDATVDGKTEQPDGKPLLVGYCVECFAAVTTEDYPMTTGCYRDTCPNCGPKPDVGQYWLEDGEVRNPRGEPYRGPAEPTGQPTEAGVDHTPEPPEAATDAQAAVVTDDPQKAPDAPSAPEKPLSGDFGELSASQTTADRQADAARTALDDPANHVETYLAEGFDANTGGLTCVNPYVDGDKFNMNKAAYWQKGWQLGTHLRSWPTDVEGKLRVKTSTVLSRSGVTAADGARLYLHDAALQWLRRELRLIARVDCQVKWTDDEDCELIDVMFDSQFAPVVVVALCDLGLFTRSVDS